MLVLSRKQGQSIVIADDIVVNVVDIGHGRVQIGISAPAHMAIHREEIYRRIQEERQPRRLPVFAEAVPVFAEAALAVGDFSAPAENN